MASSLHHDVVDALGLAVPGSLRYDYVNLSAGNLPGRLEQLRDGGYDSFCLNDADIAPRDRGRIDAEVASFLRRMFPWPSPWERRDTVGTGPSDPPASGAETLPGGEMVGGLESHQP